MADPVRILVVCIGNVCRSPLAEHLLRLRLAGYDGRVDVRSAGIRALAGHPMDDLAADELRRRGGDPSGFTARQATPAILGEADLVLTATRAIRSRVLEEAPRALKRTFTLPELAAIVGSDGFLDPPATSTADLVARAASLRGAVTVADYDVPDPIGRPPE
ncbi:MAG: low molecular weight phosphatase family protein, partial [Nocardioidaceae bacterium]|nr:low molecular weight phosphatase family protein [Nocardioidaceae bacterium]